MSAERYESRRNAVMQTINRVLDSAQRNGIDPDQAIRIWAKVPRSELEIGYAQMDPEYSENLKEKILHKNTGGGIATPKNKLSIKELKYLIKQKKKELGRTDIKITGLKKNELLKIYNNLK